MNSKLPYILAIVLGLTVPFIFTPEMKLFPIILGLIYFLGGSLFGFLWPKESWRWGIWIVGPIIVLIGLSVLFAGGLEIFLKKDLPMLILAIIAACLGSFLLARFKLSRAKRT
jgi:hypothetical protein